MDTYEIEETPLPTGAGSPGWDDFVDLVAVRNEVEIAGYGTDEVADPPEELLIHWNDPKEPRRYFVVRHEGRVVAYAMYERPEGDDADTCWIDVRVKPGFERRGIGHRLAERVERVARDDGMARMIYYGVANPGDGERLVPGTGEGSIARETRQVRFLIQRGWQLEQIERASRLALPLDPAELAGRLADAATASGPDYRVHEWTVPSPERWLDDLALMYTRMSTDAPQGELDEPEDPWTAERLAERELAYSSGPTGLITAAVEHVPSGHLVGFTQLRVPRKAGSVVSQWDTIVLSEHRGHRLGMLLKLANLDHLQRVAPGHTSVVTWNAEENRHMLAVNEAVGFIPFGAEGAWKKLL
jgi:GNAT superfamily N-acetyltransferase